jgi:hypothetical protein
VTLAGPKLVYAKSKCNIEQHVHVTIFPKNISHICKKKVPLSYARNPCKRWPCQIVPVVESQLVKEKEFSSKKNLGKSEGRIATKCHEVLRVMGKVKCIVHRRPRGDLLDVRVDECVSYSSGYLRSGLSLPADKARRGIFPGRRSSSRTGRLTTSRFFRAWSRQLQRKMVIVNILIRSSAAI